MSVENATDPLELNLPAGDLLMTPPVEANQSVSLGLQSRSGEGRRAGSFKSLICFAVASGMAITFSIAPPIGGAIRAQSTVSPVCLISTGSAAPITVIVPQSRVSELAGLGFESTSCSGAATAISEYRTQICTLAQSTSEDLKAGFAAVYGIRPENLCSYAQEIA